MSPTQDVLGESRALVDLLVCEKGFYKFKIKCVYCMRHISNEMIDDVIVFRKLDSFPADTCLCLCLCV